MRKTGLLVLCLVFGFMLVACGQTRVVLKDRQVLCPAEAPDAVFDTAEEHDTLGGCEYLLSVCRAEVDYWREGREGCD